MSNTPLSDKLIERFPQIAERVLARLKAGAKNPAYGDKSLKRPLRELIEEAKQEYEDVFGWSVIGWFNLDELEQKLSEIERRMSEMEKADLDALNKAFWNHLAAQHIADTTPRPRLDAYGVEPNGKGKVSTQ